MTYLLDNIARAMETVELPEPLTKTILDEAKSLIYGERAQQYGEDAYTSFSKVVNAFNEITGHDLIVDDFCLLMTLLKLVRNEHKRKRDNVRDAIGYLGLLDKMGRV